MSIRHPLIIILGPTAVGKTEISIQVAKELNGEIVSADSRTFYRGLDIGTAKPTLEHRRIVPHHLIDVAEPDDEWSLAQFSSIAIKIIDDIHERGRIPFLVGGSGQYIRAIVEGWIPPPREEDRSFREKLEKFVDEKGYEALHRRLASVDPESAGRIHATNVRRVIRALEIFEITGEPASRQRIKLPPPYQVLQIGLSMPREILYQRIDARIDKMLADGLVKEVRELFDKGYTLNMPALSAIGYKQIGVALQENSSIDDAVREMRKATRQLVRRQANWFKRDDPQIHWFQIEDGVIRAILDKARNFLQNLE